MYVYVCLNNGIHSKNTKGMKKIHRVLDGFL